MQTETKSHTPGPWQDDLWATGHTVSAPGSHYSICHLADCNNAESNARLIAAAPDLLEALQRLCNCVPLSVEGLHPDAQIVTSVHYWRGAYDQARAALDKATNG